MPQYVLHWMHLFYLFICGLWSALLVIGGYAFTIDATDPENDILTYGIVGTGNTYFAVDRHSGNVTVKKELDREVWRFLQKSAPFECSQKQQLKTFSCHPLYLSIVCVCLFLEFRLHNSHGFCCWSSRWGKWRISECWSIIFTFTLLCCIHTCFVDHALSLRTKRT